MITTLSFLIIYFLYRQLSSLRWRLTGWEEEGLDPPLDQSSALTFCHKLLQMLQVTQEQKKVNCIRFWCIDSFILKIHVNTFMIAL